MKLISALSKNLILEISDKIKKQLLDKFKPQTEDGDDVILSNIDLFDRYKQGLPADKRDITRYSYAELKSVLQAKSSIKTFDDLYNYFKRNERGLDNNTLKKYVRRYLDIQSALPKQKQDPTKLGYYDVVKLVDASYNEIMTSLLFKKFTKENPGLNKETLTFYIGSFINNRDRLPNETKSVLSMSFDEFEHTIDALPSVDADVDAFGSSNEENLIYDENNLKIYLATTKNQCIKLAYGRSWCISRSGSGNMYYNYRLGHERTIYYVIDSDKEFNDLNYAVVILVDPNGRKAMADRSNSGRFGGSTNMSWNEISDKVPKLANLENLFAPIPLTQEEKDLIQKVERARVGDNPMEAFNSEYETEMWLEINSPTLQPIQFANLTPKLKKKYIGLGMSLDAQMIRSAEPEVLVYYITKKVGRLGRTDLNNLSADDIELLNINIPEMRRLKATKKEEFARSLTLESGKILNIDYPGGLTAKFAALYGMDEIFNSVGTDIESIVIENKSDVLVDFKIPPTIGKFKNLSALALFKCTSEIPEEIGKLKKMMVLTIKDCPGIEKLPQNIVKLPELMFVNLSGSNPELPRGFTTIFEDLGDNNFYRIA